ncbi:hypothetical protein PSH61_19620 [Pseudomonas rhodesiae]|uniref:hypothetical protein n=1 Tax=Pseudomonas TaxID=286 RepID=UPI002736B48B|nr:MULTISPECIES: hypothetical protein [Pseudomonas]MEA1031583.1 hypothetical protein [Pseudomonas sp. N-137]WLI28015.1 hypothetical protein PSH61_19620 [Pseudomonas rhodesiae]
MANHTLASAQLIESIPLLQVMVILFASAERKHYAGRVVRLLGSIQASVNLTGLSGAAGI